MYRHLYQQFFNWLLKWQNLGLELGAFIDGDSSGNDRPRHSTCTAKSLLGTNKYIWYVLKWNNTDAIVSDFYEGLFDQFKASLATEQNRQVKLHVVGLIRFLFLLCAQIERLWHLCLTIALIAVISGLKCKRDERVNSASLYFPFRPVCVPF